MKIMQNKIFFKLSLGFLMAFLLYSNAVYSQNFKWLKTYGQKTSELYVRQVTAEQDGGCFILMQFNTGSKPDTLKLGSYTVSKANLLLLKLDSSGTIVRLKFLGNVASGLMCKDEEGNFYLSGSTNNDTIIFDSVKVYRKNGPIILAKYDKNLNRIWLTQTGKYAPSKIGIPSAGLMNLCFSSGHLLFIAQGRDTISFGSKTYNLLNNTFSENYIYGEFDISNGSVLWSNNLYNNIGGDPNGTNPTNFFINAIQYLKGYMFLSVGVGPKTIKLGSDSLSTGSYLLQTDSIGIYKKNLSVKNMNFFCLTTDGDFLYGGGSCYDSFIWGRKKYYSGWAGKSEFFTASFTKDLTPRWLFRPKILDQTQKISGSGHITLATTNEGYIYFGGRITTSVLMDKDTLIPSSFGDILLVKMDYLGNILWAENGGSKYAQMVDIEALAGRNVFAGGDYQGNIKFGKLKDTAYSKFYGWVLKISDNTIFRGNVKKGPYCAGDTILVPYSKEGDFDSTNYFIAELSDEEGDFETGYEELGRIKSNNNGTVKGKLPLLNVYSSARYRIRIRSTKPAVQSFYRIDTLRLLIYSRDKANPGPPEWVCKGDTVQLNTYGGTKWKWSPNYRMDNTTLRQPHIWPISDTTYKIIISDSSGCGAPDTAYKKIYMRQNLKAVLAFNDTGLCKNITLKIPAHFIGGDSNYHWQLYVVNSSKSWSTYNQGNLKQNDTLIYTATLDSAKISERIALVLWDECSSKRDTSFMSIWHRNPIFISTQFKDMTVCTGVQLKWMAKTSAALGTYQWLWNDMTLDSIISTTDSLKLKATATTNIKLSLISACNMDTSVFKVLVKPPLQANILFGLTLFNDTSICLGKSLKLNASGNGGDSTGRKFKWMVKGKMISSADTLLFEPGLTSILTLTLNDNCTVWDDSISKTITVLPAPKANFSYGQTCSRMNTDFTFTGSKPQSPITTTFLWNFNNESSSTLENPSHKFSNSGTKTSTLTLTSNNGCRDTLTKTIEIKPQSIADFSADDVCETDSASFKNLSQDATGYNWRFGDGQNSSISNPKHKYQISSTTTYNVTLVAQVNNGCADSISKAVTINQNPSSDFSYVYNGTKVDLKITKSGNSYQWKFGTTDSIKTTATTYTQIIKSNDQINVCLIATDISGCSSQTCKNVSVGISNILKTNGFKLYPNPNSGSFTIEIDNPCDNISIEVYDVLGKLVRTIETIPNKSSYTIDFTVGEVRAGIYLMRVKNGGLVWNQRVLVSAGEDTNR